LLAAFWASTPFAIHVTADRASVFREVENQIKSSVELQDFWKPKYGAFRRGTIDHIIKLGISIAWSPTYNIETFQHGLAQIFDDLWCGHLQSHIDDLRGTQYRPFWTKDTPWRRRDNPRMFPEQYRLLISPILYQWTGDSCHRRRALRYSLE
ncbi:hypothetical protein LTR82_017460, partial [Friedmanniomyces endolithicus]